METNFNEEEFAKALKDLKPTDGTDWDDPTRRTYAAELFRARKDMTKVARNMKLPMKTCLAYYLGTFKASDDYRLLKTVCCEDRMERLEALEHGIDACSICGDGGQLLICDGCEREFHLGCMRPRLAKVPEGEWECDECVATKFLAIREYILSKTKLYVPSQHEGNTVNGEVAKQIGNLMPAEAVKEATRQFAQAETAALSGSITT